MSLMVLGLTVAMGALGAVIRWLVWLSLNRFGRARLAIAIVNITGSALVGGIAALPTFDLSTPLSAGLCAGLTTFSTLAVQLVHHDEGEPPRKLFALAALHIVLGVSACFGAHAVVSLWV